MSNQTVLKHTCGDRPIPFEGTDEEAAENFASHEFFPCEERCQRCDSKTWHAAAHYPCGDEPPRIVVEYEDCEACIKNKIDAIEEW